MANTRSAKKRIRQNESRRLKNKTVRTRTRTYVRRARHAIEQGDSAQAQLAVEQAIVELDRAASKGVLHRNTTSRNKSRLMKSLAKLAQSG